MNLPLILLGLIAIINCPSHALNQEETYNDVLNRVLKEFDYGKEKEMDKRSEEYYAAAAKDPSKESIGMPGVSPQKHDSYICYGQKVPQDEYYIGFQPKAEMQTAHHLLLFGCEVPFEIQKSWSCGEMHPVCKSGNQHILYAWGKNAPALKLPKGVGFRVGPSTNIKYLVLQVHYGNVEKFIGTKLKDYSGVIMDTTTEKLRYRAGIYVLAEGFSSIPPHEKKWHLDTGCAYQGEADLYPFAVRVHAHKLATAISGYRVRGGKWTLIHKDNPQRPQAFYPLDKQMKIGKGDHLEARCTYNSMSRDTVTHIGATMKDEMCNFYIMYYYDSKMYETEPPGMCAWGGLDDKMKFPPGSDVLEPSSPESDNKAKHLQYEAVPKWSSDVKFGQVSGVAVDNKGFVVVFHRAGRTWDGNTFNTDNTLRGNPGPIEADTLAWFNQETGKHVMTWGKNLFYLPHGLTVDHAGNIWLTDVGSHQVFKFHLMKSKKALLTLGKKGKPGSDRSSFCKPTDVAVDRSGVFYVSDGYCNSRILMFSPKGQVLLEISNKDLKQSSGAKPGVSFNIPHSVALDEKHQELYVADRENGRVLVFSALFGKHLRTISKIFGDTVYAVSFKDGYLYAVSGPGDSRGFTYNVKTKEAVTWGRFTRPHDLAVSKDGDNIYVGEIGPNKLWKFKRSN